MSACYWLQMSDQLIAVLDPSRLAGAGLRVVPDAPMVPAGDGRTHFVMVRDEDAPAELKDCRVELDLSVHYSPAHPDGVATITGRRVVALSLTP